MDIHEAAESLINLIEQRLGDQRNDSRDHLVRNLGESMRSAGITEAHATRLVNLLRSMARS